MSELAERRLWWLLMILVLVGVNALVSGCSSMPGFLRFDWLRTKVVDDVSVWQRDVAQFGSDSDKLCAKAVGEGWAQAAAVLDLKDGGILAESYRALLIFRYIESMRKTVPQSCGGLMLEWLIMIGQQSRFAGS